jgi:hypothetical protein
MSFDQRTDRTFCGSVIPGVSRERLDDVHSIMSVNRISQVPNGWIARLAGRSFRRGKAAGGWDELIC